MSIRSNPDRYRDCNQKIIGSYECDDADEDSITKKPITYVSREMQNE